MRRFVRFGTIGIAIAAWAVAVFAAPRPAKLPGAALHSEFLWRTEIAAGILLGLLLVFVTVMRGWRGELPYTFSEKGASWSEVVDVAEDGLAAAKDELAATGNRMDQLQIQIDSLAPDMSEPLPEQAKELKPVLLRVGGSLGLSTEEAHDAVRETFITVFVLSDQISEDSELERVLFDTFGRIVNDYERRRSRAGLAPILGAGVSAAPEAELPRATELAAYLARRESTDPTGAARDNALSILETRRLAARAEAERQRTAALSAEERLGKIRDMLRGL